MKKRILIIILLLFLHLIIFGFLGDLNCKLGDIYFSVVPLLLFLIAAFRYYRNGKIVKAIVCLIFAVIFYSIMIDDTRVTNEVCKKQYIEIDDKDGKSEKNKIPSTITNNNNDNDKDNHNKENNSKKEDTDEKELEQNKVEKDTNNSTPIVKPEDKEEPEEIETDVFYKNCNEVKAADAAPLKKNDPGYSTKLDRDKDGIACDN